MKMRNYILGGLAALTLVVVAACGGGQGAPGQPFPAPTNNAVGSLLPNGVAVTLPVTPGLAVGSANIEGSGSVTVTQSVTNPSAVPILQLKKRMTAGSAQPEQAASNTPVAYVTVTAQGAVSLSRVILTIVPTTTLPSGTYYLAFWNGSQWVTIGAAAKITGNEISVSTGTLTPALSLASGQSYYLAVYTGAIFTTPTPEPSAPIASPNPVSMGLLSSTQVSVTTSAGLTITATSSNTNIATVTASATANALGVATFTVTSVNPGSTTLTFTDPINQKTTDVVTVNNQLASPSPSPGVVTMGVTQSTTVQITTSAGLAITASSSNSSIASTTSSTVTATPGGIAAFTVNANAAGTATLTFSDPYNDTTTVTINVSSIVNGAFTQGLTGWTPCSFAKVPYAAMYSPAPNPTPTAWSTQKPTLSYTPVPAASLAPLVVATAVPPNLIVNATASPADPPNVGSTAPPVIGSTVALLGSRGDIASPAGEFGVCQTFTVSSASPYLTFWVWEGGSSYKFSQADQEADILDSTGTTLVQQLFAELNCFQDQNITGFGNAGQYSYDCDPTSAPPNQYYDWVNGGFWVQRGPYNLLTSTGSPGNLTAGTQYTLYVGQWSYYANVADSYYSQYMFLGDVQTSSSSTFPTMTPMDRRSIKMAMPTKRVPVTVQTGVRPH